MILTCCFTKNQLIEAEALSAYVAADIIRESEVVELSTKELLRTVACRLALYQLLEQYQIKWTGVLSMIEVAHDVKGKPYFVMPAIAQNNWYFHPYSEILLSISYQDDNIAIFIALNSVGG